MKDRNRLPKGPASSPRAENHSPEGPIRINLADLTESHGWDPFTGTVRIIGGSDQPRPVGRQVP